MGRRQTFGPQGVTVQSRDRHRIITSVTAEGGRIMIGDLKNTLEDISKRLETVRGRL
jgi:hypothetical protein